MIELENLSLSPILIQNLYRNNLVGVSQGPTAVEKDGATPSFLGGNERRVTVVVNSAEVAFLSPANLDFLTKMLAACALTLQDVAIVNIAVEKKFGYQHIKEVLKARNVLLFGVPTSTLKLPFAVPDYQVQSYDDCLYLTAPSLDILEDDTVQKKLLWASFKKFFGL
jgi:hypothetical protein